MANGALDVVVRFVGDASGLQKEAGKIDDVGSKLGGFAKTAGVALAGAFSVGVVADWVSGAEEAQATSAKLAKTLGNAGDATGEWAKHAEDLASSLSAEAAIDDDVIKGGQTILATFHAVSGEAGQAAGVFDRATKAAVDLSATGFGSVESAATMLGKALEDPTKGISALGKAGVTFTDVQKEQIAGFMAVGDAASAQAIILANVESQVGGVAAASATAGDKMSVAFGNAQESIGTALIPVLQQLAPLLQTIASFVEANATWLVPLAGAVLAVVAAVKAWTIVQTIINVLMTANPIGIIIVAIGALIAAIVILVLNWDKVKDAAMAAFDWIKDHWPLLLGILLGPIAGAVALIVTHWDTIKSALSGAIDAMKGLWDGFVGFVASIPGRILAAFSGLVGQFFTLGREMIDAVGRGIASAASSVVQKAKDIGGSIVDAINPFGSPHRLSYYAGQEMMREYAAGIESRQRALSRTMAGVGVSTLGAGGRGGARITVNVTAPVGSNPAEIGRTVADYLDAFYRRNGNRTRAVA